MINQRAQQSILPPRWVSALLVFALLVWVLYELTEVVVLLLVSYAVAYVINPWLDYLENRKISRSTGIISVLVLIGVLITLVLMTVLPVLAREYLKLIENLPGYIEAVKIRAEPLIAKLSEYFPWLSQAINGGQVDLPLSSDLAKDVTLQVLGVLRRTALSGYSLTMTMVNLVLVPFITYYIAADFKALHLGALEFFPLLKRNKVKKLFLEIDKFVSAFVRGQLLVCTILAILYATGLSLVGVELAFLLGMIAGFGNLIPYFGFLVGIVLSTLMALITFGDLTHIFYVWGVFVVVQVLEGFVITPRVLGRTVGLSPLTIMLAIIIGGSLFGMLGIFLAVPVAAALRVIVSHVKTWINSAA